MKQAWHCRASVNWIKFWRWGFTAVSKKEFYDRLCGHHGHRLDPGGCMFFVCIVLDSQFDFFVLVLYVVLQTPFVAA